MAQVAVSSGRSAPVAVGAPDLALGYLGLNDLPTGISAYQVGEIILLFPRYVVEVEYYRVSLAAIHAWVLPQVLEHQPAIPHSYCPLALSLTLPPCGVTARIASSIRASLAFLAVG